MPCLSISSRHVSRKENTVLFHTPLTRSADHLKAFARVAAVSSDIPPLAALAIATLPLVELPIPPPPPNPGILPPPGIFPARPAEHNARSAAQRKESEERDESAVGTVETQRKAETRKAACTLTRSLACLAVRIGHAALLHPEPQTSTPAHARAPRWVY